MAHKRQSRPDDGLDFQVKAMKTCYVVPSSLDSGTCMVTVRTLRTTTSQKYAAVPTTGSYVRRIDFVYHSTLGLRVIQKKKKVRTLSTEARGEGRCPLPQLGADGSSVGNF